MINLKKELNKAIHALEKGDKVNGLVLVVDTKKETQCQIKATADTQLTTISFLVHSLIATGAIPPDELLNVLSRLVKELVENPKNFPYQGETIQ